MNKRQRRKAKKYSAAEHLYNLLDGHMADQPEVERVAAWQRFSDVLRESRQVWKVWGRLWMKERRRRNLLTAEQ